VPRNLFVERNEGKTWEKKTELKGSLYKVTRRKDASTELKVPEKLRRYTEEQSGGSGCL
jgi:hypothetical protein